MAGCERVTCALLCSDPSSSYLLLYSARLLAAKWLSTEVTMRDKLF